MFVVTGANGPYGRLVVEHLRRAVPAEEIAVGVRDPGAAAPLAAAGIRVRRADFDEPGTLPAAFADVTTILINGTNYGTPTGARARQQEAAIGAAVAAGARRIVVTGWPNAENCTLSLARDCLATERIVAASGVAWTVLRLMVGMPLALARDVRSAVAAGVLRAPAGTARVTAAAPEDLAEAGAAVLTGTGHEGRTYELTGPDAITWDDLAGLAGTLAGRPVRYHPVVDGEFEAMAREAGFPPAVVEGLRDYYAAVRSGWAATPRPDLGELLGRPPVASLDAVRAAAA